MDRINSDTSEVKVKGVFQAGQEAWQLMMRVTELRHQIQQLLLQDTRFASMTITWQEAQATYRAFQIWQQYAPIEARHRSVTPEAKDSATPTFRKQYTFANVQHGIMWTGIWCSQIRLLESMMAFAKKFKPPKTSNTDDIEQPEIRDALTVTVEAICASSSYMMAEIGERGEQLSSSDSRALGAFYHVRGLSVALDVETITDEQKSWVLLKLWQIGHSKGIKQALRARDRYLTRP